LTVRKNFIHRGLISVRRLMSSQITTLESLASNITKDPELADAIKQDPAGTIATIAAEASALSTDRWTYRIVVLALGISVIVGLLGLIALSWKGVQTVPDGLVAIGSAAVGALAGLLAPSPKTS
jgi:hypothetical protein